MLNVNFVDTAKFLISHFSFLTFLISHFSFQLDFSLEYEGCRTSHIYVFIFLVIFDL